MIDGCVIGINGLFLDYPHTGTGVYTREVLTRLLAPHPPPPSPSRGEGEQMDTARYVLFGHPEHAAAFRSRTGISYIALQAPLRRRSDNVEKVLWEQVTLPLAAARCGVDLLYAPYFSLPLWASARTVLTVHDLIPLMMTEYAPSAQLKAYFRLVSAAARRAAAVVTDSRHSAGDIARMLHVPRERIHVIYLGVDPRFGRPVAPERMQALRDRLGLPERFMLYLGGTDPRKNITVLLQALRLLRQSGRAVAPLALPVGQRAAAVLAGWESSDPRAEAARLGVERDVIFLNRIDDDDKPALYATAVAFAYPSRYEGFGLPPLEAMASGTPVLCAHASSLPEVTGDAAIMLDPDNAHAWANAFERIDQDAALRADLAARGRAQAAAFTWERTVTELRRVFQRVLED